MSNELSLELLQAQVKSLVAERDALRARAEKAEVWSDFALGVVAAVQRRDKSLVRLDYRDPETELFCVREIVEEHVVQRKQCLELEAKLSRTEARNRALQHYLSDIIRQATPDKKSPDFNTMLPDCGLLSDRDLAEVVAAVHDMRWNLIQKTFSFNNLEAEYRGLYAKWDVYAERERTLGAQTEREAVLADLQDDLECIRRDGPPEDVDSWLVETIEYIKAGKHIPSENES